MKVLDGRMVADHVIESLGPDLATLKENGVDPKLTIVLVGDNPASVSYIKQKTKACEKLGLTSDQINLPETVTTEELIEVVNKLNADDSVHGILVQLPLPQHVSAPLVIKAIDPAKDVDGFTAYNIGKTFLGTEFEHLPPATPKGVVQLLEYYEINLEGQEVVMVGASNIVGKPLSVMLLNRGATVTTCHILTKDLKFHTSRADILIVAVGKADLITPEMVKDGVIVIDVGCNKVEGKLCGDVDYSGISEKASMMTPVPGGVGPMTVAALMHNTIVAAKRLSNLMD